MGRKLAEANDFGFINFFNLLILLISNCVYSLCQSVHLAQKLRHLLREAADLLVLASIITIRRPLSAPCSASFSRRRVSFSRSERHRVQRLYGLQQPDDVFFGSHVASHGVWAVAVSVPVVLTVT